MIHDPRDREKSRTVFVDCFAEPEDAGDRVLIPASVISPAHGSRAVIGTAIRAGDLGAGFRAAGQPAAQSGQIKQYQSNSAVEAANQPGRGESMLDDEERRAELEQERSDRRLARILKPLFIILFLLLMVWIISKNFRGTVG